MTRNASESNSICWTRCCTAACSTWSSITAKTGHARAKWATPTAARHSPQLYVEIVAEIDTSSLECIGVLSYPEDIDAAVLAFLKEKLRELKQKLKDEANWEERARLEEEIKGTKKDLKEAREEKGRGGEFKYWDTELTWDRKLRRLGPPQHREIYLIETKDRKKTKSGDVTRWFVVDGRKGKKKRKSKDSDIWTELSSLRLGPAGTEGRYATEKLEKAIKMHCPFANLQPLVTY